jgi:ATP-dependent helicase/nuclease subunit A
MRYPDPTDEQWQAIRSTDDHLLVSSSAGTGKTFTIVARILYQLGVEIGGEVCPAPIELADVAAITFTNKAAAELRTKLRQRLRDAGRKREFYRLDAARIGTIHSFCANVLREFSLRTGRAPRLELIDEAEDVALRYDSVREAMLTALEGKLIPGLEETVAAYKVKDIEQQVVRLIAQADRLSSLLERVDEHELRERSILQLAALARDTLVTSLETNSRVDYDRLVIWTRDLLRDDPTVRRALQRRIKVLFIDEFQDVDPAQREIAYLLGEPANWRTTTTRLVLVGDPKQSIYRFRNADVTVWRDVQRDFSERGWKNTRVVPLLANQRSVPAILGFVDHAVGKLLDSPISGAALADYEIPYAAMTPSRGEADGCAVEVIAVPSDNGKVRGSPESRLIEAEAVADRVRALHDGSGYHWNEIAILLCAWGDADKYDDALRARDVPTYVLRDEGFYDCLEVTDVLVALDAVRSLSNDRTLLGVLRSPFVGLTDESLLRIARQCTAPYWNGLSSVTLPDPREQELLSRGIALLSRFASLRDKISTAELIDTILIESGYLAHLELLGPEAKQRIANLRKLVRLARAMPESSVGDFLEAAARQRELKALEAEAQLYGEREDVVTITSVHCAKGLDWKAVFWCDLLRTPKPHAKNELQIGRDRVMMHEVDGEPPLSFTALVDELENERVAETRRLWYVASTRAKDLLVLSGIPLGTGGRLKGSPAEHLRTLFPRLEEGVADFESARGVRYSAKVTIASAERSAASVVSAVPSALGDPRELAKPHAPVVVPYGRGKHSATELLSMSRCEQRHWFRYVAGLKEPALHEHTKAASSNAIRRGLVVHDVLENYHEDLELGVLIEAAIGRWDPDAPPPEHKRGTRYRRRLAAGVESILGSPQYRAVLENEGAKRELGFTYVHSEGECVQGAIDLIAPGADGYAIVDVKTSETDEEGAAKKAEMYAPQRAAYSEAVEGITESSVASFGFQFAGTGAFVGGDLTEEQRESDSATLERLIQLARAGERRLTTFPAECEFCGYRRAGWCSGVTPEAVIAEQALAAETES